MNFAPYPFSTSDIKSPNIKPNQQPSSNTQKSPIIFTYTPDPLTICSECKRDTVCLCAENHICDKCKKCMKHSGLGVSSAQCCRCPQKPIKPLTSNLSNICHECNKYSVCLCRKTICPACNKNTSCACLR
jgi:hypothetical protein